MVNISKNAQLNNVNISYFTAIHNVNIMIISYSQGGKTPGKMEDDKMKKTAYFRFMCTSPAEIIKMCADALEKTTLGRWTWADARRLERDVEAFLERDNDRPADELEMVIDLLALYFARQQRKAAAIH